MGPRGPPNLAATKVEVALSALVVDRRERFREGVAPDIRFKHGEILEEVLREEYPDFPTDVSPSKRRRDRRFMWAAKTTDRGLSILTKIRKTVVNEEGLYSFASPLDWAMIELVKALSEIRVEMADLRARGRDTKYWRSSAGHPGQIELLRIIQRLPAALVLFERTANSSASNPPMPKWRFRLDLVKEIKRFRRKPTGDAAFQSRKSRIVVLGSLGINVTFTASGTSILGHSPPPRYETREETAQRRERARRTTELYSDYVSRREGRR